MPGLRARSWSSTPPGSRSARAGEPERIALGAVAIGATAIGSFAVGALAVGALAIGRLRVREASFDRVSIRALDVEELRVAGQPFPAVADPGPGPDSSPG